MSTNTVTKEQIEGILEQAQFECHTVFEKCTVVICKLPNGFVITESSAYVDPANYDELLGFEICKKRITDKLWELEGYLLQSITSTISLGCCPTPAHPDHKEHDLFALMDALRCADKEFDIEFRNKVKAKLESILGI